MRETFGDFFATFLFGGLVAVMVLMGLIETSPTSHKNVVDNAIKECEKSLPRDQHCKIIAIPETKE
jgi:hypothetical protein